jgi:hypothetical protein
MTPYPGGSYIKPPFPGSGYHDPLMPFPSSGYHDPVPSFPGPSYYNPAPTYHPQPKPFYPTETVESFKASFKQNPGNGLHQFLKEGYQLELHEQALVAADLVGKLKGEVFTTKNPYQALKKVQEFIAVVNDPNLEIPAGLDRAEFTLWRDKFERHASASALEELVGLGKGGKWTEAAKVAKEHAQWFEEWIKDAHNGDVKTSTFPKGFGGLLKNLQQHAERQTALDKLNAVVSQPGPKAGTALADVPLQVLPKELQEGVKAWHGALTLQQACGASGKQPPNVKALQQAIKDLVAANGEMALPLAQRLHRELAVKAFLDGHPAAALELLQGEQHLTPGQATGGAGHAALLRDLEALAFGEGTVSTWPGQQALAPAQPGAPTGPPAGVQFLLPEGDAAGWRPPVAENATNGLPPLNQTLATVAQQQQQQTKTQAATYTAVLHQQQLSLLQHVSAVQAKLHKEKETDECGNIVEVEQGVGRSLTAQERQQVVAWIFQGYSVQAIIGHLRDGTPLSDPLAPVPQTAEKNSEPMAPSP